MEKKNYQYTKLEVWKESRKQVNLVYQLTKRFPKDELYGLTNQIRRASVSISSNIAEGCGRQTSKDSMHFFHISRGSIYEIETQFYLAFDQNYINRESLDEIFNSIET